MVDGRVTTGETKEKADTEAAAKKPTDDEKEGKENTRNEEKKKEGIILRSGRRLSSTVGRTPETETKGTRGARCRSDNLQAEPESVAVANECLEATKMRHAAKERGAVEAAKMEEEEAMDIAQKEELGHRQMAAAKQRETIDLYNKKMQEMEEIHRREMREMEEMQLKAAAENATAVINGIAELTAASHREIKAAAQQSALEHEDSEDEGWYGETQGSSKKVDINQFFVAAKGAEIPIIRGGKHTREHRKDKVEEVMNLVDWETEMHAWCDASMMNGGMFFQKVWGIAARNMKDWLGKAVTDRYNVQMHEKIMEDLEEDEQPSKQEEVFAARMLSRVLEKAPSKIRDTLRMKEAVTKGGFKGWVSMIIEYMSEYSVTNRKDKRALHKRIAMGPRTSKNSGREVALAIHEWQKLQSYLDNMDIGHDESYLDGAILALGKARKVADEDERHIITTLIKKSTVKRFSPDATKVNKFMDKLTAILENMKCVAPEDARHGNNREDEGQNRADCHAWARGHCSRGEHCRFKHDPRKKGTASRDKGDGAQKGKGNFWGTPGNNDWKGKEGKGDRRAPQANAANGKGDVDCAHWVRTGRCKLEEKCKYRHDDNKRGRTKGQLCHGWQEKGKCRY